MLKNYTHQVFSSLLVLFVLMGMPATVFAQSFSSVTGTGNPFNGEDVGSYASPSFGDLDGDGDIDCLVGEGGSGGGNGKFNYFRNDGTASAPDFTAFNNGSGSNPLEDVDVGTYSAPFLVDLDADGDLDIVIGEGDGVLNFYRNNGSGSFSNRTGSNNPFNGIDIGTFSIPALVDVDGDGDMDLFIGEGDGNINFFRNTGNASAPAFTEVTGANNPFDGVDLGSDSAPSFVDLDKDGDMDAVIGESDGTFNYFQNTGNAIAPVFTQRTGSQNPFDGFDVGDASVPAFADLDNNTNMDLFAGASNGQFFFYQNTSPLPVELIRFDAARSGNSVLLTWVTATELNNQGFEIQRSADSRLWLSLGFVDGMGNSLQTQEYRFNDARPTPGLSYYRLKQVDFDGTVAFSNTIEMVNAPDASQIAMLLQDATDSRNLKVMIFGQSSSQIQMNLMDLSGKNVMSKNLVVTEGTSVVEALNLSTLPAGVYALWVTDNRVSFSQKIQLK